MKISLTERARKYIATAAERILESNEKPVLAVWAERIHS